MKAEEPEVADKKPADVSLHLWGLPLFPLFPLLPLNLPPITWSLTRTELILLPICRSLPLMGGTVTAIEQTLPRIEQRVLAIERTLASIDGSLPPVDWTLRLIY